MNKDKNDKTIQLVNSDVKYVIVTQRDGTWKYIGKKYGYKYQMQFSTKMKHARTFDSISHAQMFIDNYHLYGKKYYICQMNCNYSVNFRP